tara:strand:+ start:412 stop:660 length:249 start_codon:yes stop_codon:yes gene_type:complete
MNNQYNEYVIWGVKPNDKNKPKYLQESILQTECMGQVIINKEVADKIADSYEAEGFSNVRIQAIPFHKGCESDLAKQFTGGK